MSYSRGPVATATVFSVLAVCCFGQAVRAWPTPPITCATDSKCETTTCASLPERRSDNCGGITCVFEGDKQLIYCVNKPNDGDQCCKYSYTDGTNAQNCPGTCLATPSLSCTSDIIRKCFTGGGSEQ